MMAVTSQMEEEEDGRGFNIMNGITSGLKQVITLNDDRTRNLHKKTEAKYLGDISNWAITAQIQNQYVSWRSIQR
ncbi:hypothetical protein CEXT_191881 [Caerostris extrusa]|uniref:Uncharacterized protein n=1 Tax=Caerostris extrusa TaxID=172846 RepID=A0AAV4QDU0_CAEEX|nr:hypothetical protein CEXT_191881 [Caerostris extrusa]